MSRTQVQVLRFKETKANLFSCIVFISVTVSGFLSMASHTMLSVACLSLYINVSRPVLIPGDMKKEWEVQTRPLSLLLI